MSNDVRMLKCVLLTKKLSVKIFFKNLRYKYIYNFCPVILFLFQ